MGLYAPQGLPDDVKTTLVNAVAKAAKEPSFVSKIEAIGLFFSNTKSRRQHASASSPNTPASSSSIAELQH